MALGTAYDFNLVRRTGLLSAVVLAAAWLVERSTEERASGAPSLGLLPLVPVAVAVAVAFVLRRARRQGEVTALLALGVTPWRIGRGAMGAALVLSAAAGAAFAAGKGDEAALFPEATVAFEVVLVPRAGKNLFRSEALAVDVVERAGQWRLEPTPDAEMASSRAQARAAERPGWQVKRRRWMVGFTLTMSGPMLAAMSMSPPRALVTVVVLFVYAVSQVVAFQLVGLHRLPPEALILPVLLLAIAWWVTRSTVGVVPVVARMWATMFQGKGGR